MKKLLAVLLFLSTPASAAPVATITGADFNVLFYDEPCAIKGLTNLPYRTTWQYQGKTFEGCFGAFPLANAIAAAYVDGTVVAFPANALRKVTQL